MFELTNKPLSYSCCSLKFILTKLLRKDDDISMYRSDSDESIRRYHIDQHSSQHLIPRPQSTLSLSQLSSYRRRSNPDIYPGVRRFSTSYSDEDILSNDQLDQIHFDPRYRDYRSASSLNNSNCRLRSNSLHSMCNSSAGYITPQYQPYRRVSSVSPPYSSALTIPVPLAPQRRWNTNPSIFIEEYRDDENQQKSTQSDAIKNEKKNSNDSLINTSNDSLLQQGLSESDIKSFGDLSQIPFIDDEDDSNDFAPCRFGDNNTIVDKKDIRSCRKTVSFDVIQPTSSTSFYGKNFPPSQSKCFYSSSSSSNLKNVTNSSSYSSCSPHYSLNKSRAMMMTENVRTTKDGYIPRSNSQSSPPPLAPPRRQHSSSTLFNNYDDDHCILVDKLIKIRKEEDAIKNESHHCHCHNHHRRLQQQQCHCTMDQVVNEEQKINYDSSNIKVKEEDKSNCASGKVKALTSYFNSLPYKKEQCNCIKIHQSTPNLSSPSFTRYHSNKLSCDEMTAVRKQLKELTDFGDKSSIRSECMRRSFSTPNLCHGSEKEEEIFSNCIEYKEMLNRLDKVRIKRLMKDECHFIMPKYHRCRFSSCINNADFSLSSIRRPMTSQSHQMDGGEKVKVQNSSSSLSTEKHRCRSACFNINKDPLKKKKKKQEKMKLKLVKDDDNESLII